MPPKKKETAPKDTTPVSPTVDHGPFRLSFGPDGTPEKVYADGHRAPVDE